MAKSKDQVRFGILWNGLAYDLFSISRGKDETIYLKSYFKGSKTGLIHISTANQANTRVAVNLNEPTKFNLEVSKFSFHCSGYIHCTDKKGGRVKEHDGNIGLAFEKIVDAATLFSLYPAKPEKYRPHPSLDKDVKLVDVQSLGFVPWQITCYLSRSTHDFSSEATRLHNRYKSLFLRIKDYLPKHGLDLIARFHQSSSNIFPVGEVVCYFTVCSPDS